MPRKSHPTQIMLSLSLPYSRKCQNLYDLVANDIFSDPFNVVHGKDGFCRIFDHMFETCNDPKFTVSDVAPQIP